MGDTAIQADCDVCRLLGQKAGVITDTICWRVLVSYDQLYLGRSLVVLKSHVAKVGELPLMAWAELNLLMADFEQAVSQAFGAVNCNWALLMNDGWPDTHVHWHVRPRYDQPVELMGHTYIDPDWPKHYGRDKAFLDPNEEDRVKDLIAKNIRENLQFLRLPSPK